MTTLHIRISVKKKTPVAALPAPEAMSTSTALSIVPSHNTGQSGFMLSPKIRAALAQFNPKRLSLKVAEFFISKRP